MWILEEPVAAAIEVIRDEEVSKKVFVVDIGGGTFDLSVLEADEQQHIYTEIALDGDPRLGGDDFDEALRDRLIEIIKDDSGNDLSSLSASGLDESDYLRKRNILLKAAQKAKKELSDESEEVDIEVSAKSSTRFAARFSIRYSPEQENSSTTAKNFALRT